MAYRRAYGERPRAGADASDAEAFRLVAIRPTTAPKGHSGRDWLAYEIAQGRNVITGYRRGDLQTATADVERIVVGLNERRVASKSRPGPKPKSGAGASAQAAVEVQPPADAGEEP